MSRQTLRILLVKMVCCQANKRATHLEQGTAKHHIFVNPFSFSPANARTGTEPFYLQPERSCVPDSPVWYSPANLNEHSLEKMLHRQLMVREVQEHMLSDGQS